MNKVEEFVKLYSRWVLLPVFIGTACLLMFLYITEPEAFVYDCNAHYMLGQELAYSEGVFFYGLQLHEGFYVERLDMRACKEKESLNERVGIISTLSFVILLYYTAFRLMKFLVPYIDKKIKEFKNGKL